MRWTTTAPRKARRRSTLTWPSRWPDGWRQASTRGPSILMCGTGIGMAISANKVPGVRAAQAHDAYSAERARKSNDAQIVTMGARVIGTELAKSVIDAWMHSEFEGGRSAPKIERIEAYEAEQAQQVEQRALEDAPSR
nr:RpiB/LacA/LacB family sugar-phosphate isomerase [Deinococcus sp.]